MEVGTIVKWRKNAEYVGRVTGTVRVARDNDECPAGTFVTVKWIQRPDPIMVPLAYTYGRQKLYAVDELTEQQ